MGVFIVNYFGGFYLDLSLSFSPIKNYGGKGLSDLQLYRTLGL